MAPLITRIATTVVLTLAYYLVNNLYFYFVFIRLFCFYIMDTFLKNSCKKDRVKKYIVYAEKKGYFQLKQKILCLWLFDSSQIKIVEKQKYKDVNSFVFVVIDRFGYIGKIKKETNWSLVYCSRTTHLGLSIWLGPIGLKRIPLRNVTIK